MPRLLVLTPAELTRDPRARRQVAAARAAGYDVVGVSGRIGGDPPVALEGVEVSRVGRERLAAPLRRAGLGGGRSSGAFERELRGLFRVGRALGLTVRLARAARRLGPVDVVHANDFPTLGAGVLAGAPRLVYDAHELYAEEEADMPRVYAAFVRALEGRLARRADAVVTVSEPLARELERRLGLAATPLVVLNAPEVVDGVDIEPFDGPLRAIYQGVFAPGRPFEDLLDAAAAAEDVRLTVRIARADPDVLRGQALGRGLDERVVVADPVEPGRLVEALAGHEVGVVYNRPSTAHYEVQLPNRVFEYMMAGLAVVAPRFPALEAIVEGEGVGVLYEPGDAAALGAALTELALDRDRVLGYRRRARERALERYNAEAEAETLRRAWR